MKYIYWSKIEKKKNSNTIRNYVRTNQWRVRDNVRLKLIDHKSILHEIFDQRPLLKEEYFALPPFYLTPKPKVISTPNLACRLR